MIGELNKDITFNWESAENNYLGKKLKSIKGYNIYKSTTSIDAEKKNFKFYKFIEDTVFLLKNERIKKLRAQNLPSSKVKLTKEERLVSFVDPILFNEQVNTSYLIIPVSETGYEGLEGVEVNLIYVDSTVEVYLENYLNS